ncbi:hypothetical protein ACLB2K_027985 [Fragaria x ananassa]
MNHAVDSRRRSKMAPASKLREIEVLIISAQNLKDVKHLSHVRAYAVVYVEKDVHVVRTRVDEHGGTNPTWNDVVRVKFREEMADKEHVLAAVNVDIYAHGHVRGKPVGSARVLLCEVLKGGDAREPADNPIQCLTVQVWRPSGRPHGLLNLWIPPTGRFLIRRESLSFSVREAEEEVVEEVKGGEEE